MNIKTIDLTPFIKHYSESSEEQWLVFSDRYMDIVLRELYDMRENITEADTTTESVKMKIRDLYKNSSPIMVEAASLRAVDMIRHVNEYMVRNTGSNTSKYPVLIKNNILFYKEDQEQ